MGKKGALATWCEMSEKQVRPVRQPVERRFRSKTPQATALARQTGRSGSYLRHHGGIEQSRQSDAILRMPPARATSREVSADTARKA